MLPKLTLIIGGVASGKSSHGETLAEAARKSRLYIATAQAHPDDGEMVTKIRAHKARRGVGWTTVEAPFDPGPALEKPGADVVLLDCASMWLTNHLLAGSDLEVKVPELLEALTNCPVPVIVVSNEVGLGGVEANALARRFAKAQGQLNANLAAQADRVVLVTAGLPLTLKGG